MLVGDCGPWGKGDVGKRRWMVLNGERVRCMCSTCVCFV